MHSTQTDDALIARLLDLSPFPIVVSRLRDHSVLAINDATATLFAGTGTPDQVCQDITDAAAAS